MVALIFTHTNNNTTTRGNKMLTETLLNSRELIALTGAALVLVLPPVLFLTYLLIKGLKND
jgi:hypothetical protein